MKMDLERIGSRHRESNNNSFAAESEALDLIAKEAEARLAARRQARYEARNIRLKEIEKKQKEEQETNNSLSPSPNNSINSPPTTNPERGVRLRSGGGSRSYNERRSSTDSSSTEEGFNLNALRDLKCELKETEEKFRKAMVANAGLDNEKSALIYQVDLLKDRLTDGEENAALVAKELREKNREYELLKRSHAEATRAVQLLQAQLDEQCRLLQERGMVLVGNEEEEDSEIKSNIGDEEQEKRTRGIVSADTANILAGLGSGPLDVRIKRLADERDDLQDVVRRLKLDLEEERSRSQRLEQRKSQFTPEDIVERETKRIIDDYKFKFQKSEQDTATLQTTVARLETQVIRYKTAAETAERSEEELKTERRKLQRELREAQSRADELETSNKHLEARLGKLKTAKSNLLKEL